MADGDVSIPWVVHITTLSSSWLLRRPIRLLNILSIHILLLLQLHSPILILENSLVQICLWILTLVSSVSRLVVVDLDVVIRVSNHLLRAMSSRKILRWRSVSHLASVVGNFSLLLLFGSKLLHTSDRRPVDTISNRFTTSAKDWEWIKKRVISKYLSEVISRSNIIWTLIRFALLI